MEEHRQHGTNKPSPLLKLAAMAALFIWRCVKYETRGAQGRLAGDWHAVAALTPREPKCPASQERLPTQTLYLRSCYAYAVGHCPSSA